MDIKIQKKICSECRWWGRAGECFYPMNGRSAQDGEFTDCEFFEPYILNYFGKTKLPILEREIGFFLPILKGNFGSFKEKTNEK